MTVNSDTIIFPDFLTNKKVYRQNENYWHEFIINLLQEGVTDLEFDYVNNKFANGKKIYDGNPICCFMSKSLGKAVRIIQEAAEDEVGEFTYWIQGTEINNCSIDELVIALTLTDKSMERTKETILNFITQ